MSRGARVRILQCEFCEDGTAGGSHQALYDTVRLMDHDRYESVVVFYEDNRFVAPLREAGASVHVWKRERELEREPHRSGGKLAKLGAVVGAVQRRVRLLREERIDLVHLNNTPYLGFDDWLPAARWLSLPCITTVMGRPYHLPHERVRRWLTLRFDRLIAISDNVLDSLRAGGFPEAMLTKVALGTDLEAFKGRVRVPAERVRESLGVPPERMLVVMVGNLRQWKGHHVVVSALEQMEPELRQRLHVAFVGAARPEDEAYLAELRARLERAGATRDVSWLGGRLDVPDLVGAADVALHASTFPEPFGLVLVEAMALGKPLVAARRGGPVEVVTPETGILFDPDHPSELVAAFERLLDQPELRKAMGSAAVQRAQLYTARRMTDGMQRVWEELLAAKGARPARA
jgi:glycosyltransferase involved in cell wall biosynthesis